MVARSAFALLCALSVLAAPDLAAATAGSLTCSSNAATHVYYRCEADASVTVGANLTYTFAVDTTSATNQLYDVNLTLTPSTGDADLFVVSPNLTITGSERTVGPDIVYVYRTELVAGEYTVVVLGIAATTAFTLTVEAFEVEPELNPDETLALGEAMMECCNSYASACPALKAAYPGVYNVDGTTSYPDDVYPNFCLMHGNVCTKDRHLLELSMPSQMLQCSFPTSSILKFSRLRRIDLSGNSVTGNLSVLAPALANLTKLQYLDLSTNELGGNLSSACGLASSGLLAELDLDNNSISGGIPACLIDAPALVELRLQGNALHGTLPAIPAASPLVTLVLGGQTGSGLSGGVPALNKLKKLTYVDLSDNGFSGPLPTLPTQLWDIDLSDNELSGAIPASYGIMTSLLALDLEGNELTGSLPAGLAALAALQELDVSDNSLTGSLPQDWSDANNLILLYLQGNEFTGSIPGSMAEMEALVVLSLGGNQLTGSLADYAFVSSEDRNDLNSALRFLDFSSNGLSGDLNSYIGMRDLGVFSAPTQFETQTVLAVQTAVPRTLDLSANGFAGEFPNWLVQGLIAAPENVAVNLTVQGNTLICPPGGFTLTATPPAGRLDGLTCYAATSALSVEAGVTATNTVESQVVVSSGHLSAFAAFGIFVAVVIAMGAVGGIGYMLWQRRVRTQGQAYNGRFQSFADVAPPTGPNKFNYNTWDTQIEMSGNSYGARSQGIKSGPGSVHSTRDGH